MMNPPSVNQITKAYQGNPAPLAQKVDQDKKQNGGIPQDLRQLLALNDINQMREGAGIQAALNAPADMPTVAQNIQQQAKQALQARMVQNTQQRMAKEGQMGIPQGIPQPVPQPQGIDTLRANVGESYAHGGVVAFDQGGVMPPDTRSAEDILRDQMRVNEETKRTAEIERRKRDVGEQDTTQIDRLMNELENRKGKLAPPKPGFDAMMEYLEQIAATPRGISSVEAGSRGAASQNALQRSRMEQQNALTERGIELAQKKLDQGYQFKSDQYNVGKTAAADAIKQKYDAAIAVARTDQDRLKLAQEKDLELKKLDIENKKLGIEAQKANAMKLPAVGIQVANMLRAADPSLSKSEALRQGFLISQGGDLKTQQLDARKVKDFEDAKAKIEKQWEGKPESMLGNSKKPESLEKYNKWKEGRDAEITRAKEQILGPTSGGLPQALLTPTGAPSAPPAAGAYTVTAGGKVYNFPTQAAADAFKQASGAK